jgi:hypothetical protein
VYIPPKFGALSPRERIALYERMERERWARNREADRAPRG